MLTTILDTLLRGVQRRTDILVDREDEAARWEQQFNTKAAAFLRQEEALDLSDSSQRATFYDHVSDAHDQFEELQDDERITLFGESNLYVAVDELVSSLEEMNPPMPWDLLGADTDLEPKRTKKSREHREESIQLIDQVHKELTRCADE